MYKVVVVDDEIDIRSRVITSLKSLNLDLDIVAEFDNGMDAKNFILNDPPDILITDIKIPYISGIDLAKMISEQGLMTKVIIITGYDLFDYAKNAIEYNVTSFITKPFRNKEIEESLLKVTSIIDNEFSLNSTITKLKEFHNQNIEIIKETDLARLVNINEINDNFLSKLKEDGVDLNKKYFAFAVIDIDKGEKDINIDQYEAIRYTVDNVLNNTKTNNIHFYTFFRNNRMLALSVSDEEIKKLDLEKVYNSILITVKRVFDISFTIGVSNISSNGIKTNFRNLYTCASQALDYRSVIGGNQIIFNDDILDEEFKTLNLDENEYKELSFLLNYETIDKVNAQLDNLFIKISTTEYKYSSLFISLNILNAILKSCTSLSLLYKNYLPHYQIIQKFTSLKTPEEMLIFSKEVANEVMKVNASMKVNAFEKYYHAILRYIEANYNDPFISMDTLSEGVSLSISYISTLLKNHDTSFVKYLTYIRIEKAKELLLNPENKIVDVAEKVGYSDAYYFSHCFKKATGVSPREFRQNENKE